MYEEYGLFDNPFKCEHDHRIVGNSQNKTFDSVLEFFADKVADKQRSGDKFISVLKGEYGAGKSFFLIKLMESLMHRDSRFGKFLNDSLIAVTKFEILTEDRRLPSDVMLHLYRLIIENLEVDGERFFCQQLQKTLEKKSSSKGIDVKEMLGQLSPEFRKVVLSLSDDCQEQFIAWKWISAQKLTQKELTALGLKYSINSGKLAERFLFQLLKLLNILDYGLLVVLIDELEQILTTISEKQFLRAFLVIQEIFDKFSDIKYSHLKPITPIGFVSGMTQDAWLAIEKGSEQEQAIAAVRRRISKNIFEFETFNEADTEEFIEVLLSKARITKYKGDPLFPFEKKTIPTIKTATYGNPGWVINICGELLKKARKENVHKIGLKFVDDYLNVHGGGTSFEEISKEGFEDDFLEDKEKI